jgi:ParB/RepB/Spo0J family partition protein
VTENPNGRGLLDPHELALAAPPEAIALPCELIDPNPRNPRGKLVELDALAENIKRFGLLQPVTVRRQGDRYELIGGHRRLAAFARLREAEPLEPQWRTIPAVVRAFDDDDSYLALISAQVHAKAWKPREEAAALEQLVLRGQTVHQVGQSVNRSYAWASKRLRVYSDSILSGYVQAGQLSTGVAEELLILRDLETRRDFAERAVRENWSQDQARGRVRALRQDLERADVGRLARELHDRLDRLGEGTVSVDAFTELWSLSERIGALWQEAQGKPARRRLPSIEQAEKAAGVTAKAKARDAEAATRRQRAARAKRRAP